MKPALRWTLRIGAIALVLVVGTVVIVRTWVVPSILNARLQDQFHGPAHFDGWWLGGRSAGVSGLVLREGPGSDSEPWLSADRIETDLSIGRIVAGRVSPGRIVIVNPKLRLRFDRRGAILTKGPFSAR